MYVMKASLLLLGTDIGIKKDRLINDTYCLPCFVWFAMLVAAAQKHSVKQVLVACAKQNKQAKKAVRAASSLLLFQAETAVGAA
jgi:hypothetical protein